MTKKYESILSRHPDTIWCAWAVSHDSHGLYLDDLCFMPVGEGPETNKDWVRVPWLDSEKIFAVENTITEDQKKQLDEFRTENGLLKSKTEALCKAVSLLFKDGEAVCGNCDGSGKVPNADWAASHNEDCVICDGTGVCPQYAAGFAAGLLERQDWPDPRER